jgi:oxygen-independent coproporphyrinogen-3 oxidase
LIYARPGQTAAAWRAELGQAVELAAGHISLYQLTIEAGTAFGRAQARGRLVIPEADDAAGLYEIAQEVCGAAGLRGYEVSNHAAPGHESQHNLRYWRYQEYLGIGPGAHGRLVEDGKRWAEEQVRASTAWLSAVETTGHGRARREALSAADQATEMLMMGLRLSEGISLADFRAVTGGDLNAFVSAPQLAALETAALLTREDGRLRTTIRGRAVLDGVLGALLV